VSCSGYPDLTPFKLTAYADDVTVVVSNVDDIDINNNISLKSDICTCKLGEMYNIIDGRMERKWTYMEKNWECFSDQVIERI